MEGADSSRKRKAVTRDVDQEPDIASGDEFDPGLLDGTLSDGEEDVSSEDGSSASGEDDEIADRLGNEDEVDSELDSDEISSEEDDDADGLVKANGHGTFSSEVAAGLQLADDVSEEEDEQNYRIVKDANGNDRYIYDEINPDDNSESDFDENANTIGNIPLSFYDQYPHIGYDINGKKIMRPATGEALDALLDSIEVPKGYTGLIDPSTGKPLELTKDELELLRKVQMNEVLEDGYNPYEPTVEYFTSKLEIMPLSAAPEPKRRFVPSKHEAKRVMKIVKAIREGRILPHKPPEEVEEEEEGVQKYDIWANEEARPDHPMHIPAPKLPPPRYDESYHPPPEYLPDKQEKKAWEEADEDDREKDYLPTDHDSLRKVPGYDKFIKEKFERCLDLYLAPRVRRTKLNIDPESLLPKLPNPDELKPFPTTCATLYRGHQGRVRSVAIDPSGIWLASGGDDGTIRVWELLTGHQLWSATLSKDEPVNVVRWRPGKEAVILAAAAGDHVYLAIPPVVDPEIEAASQEILSAGFGYAAISSTKPSANTSKPTPTTWARPSSSNANVLLQISAHHTAKTLSWHRRGDHFVTVSSSPSTPASLAISIHTLSKHQTQHPFRKRMRGGGPPQTAHFHPSKPLLFVANQRAIRAYDLSKQALIRILNPGARWISSFDIHPASSSGSIGDNLIVGTYDRRLLWHDLDLDPSKPYKTLRYHGKAIRAVKFHPTHPLFADVSDDGTLQVFHGKVVGDMMANATIVPLKVLRGHNLNNGLGALDLDWHPREAWCVSAGGDGTCRLWM
jgi:ribosome biogenesis protein ERB1